MIESHMHECYTCTVHKNHNHAFIVCKVCYQDQIKFESLATNGQYLHCSSNFLPDVGFTELKTWYGYT